jgi:hypothetical protein
MPTIAAWTIYAFGATALAAGCLHLASPERAAQALGLEEGCVDAVNGESLPVSSSFFLLNQCNVASASSLSSPIVGERGER